VDGVTVQSLDLARGATPLERVAGVGEVPDAFGNVGPGPSGTGLSDREQRAGDEQHAVVGPSGPESGREGVLNRCLGSDRSGTGVGEHVREDRPVFGAIEHRFGRDDGVERGQRGGHRAVILVVHCTEDDVELVVLVRLERFRKSLTGPRIVRTVQNDQWSGIHHLEPPGQWALRSPRSRSASETSPTCRARATAMPAFLA